MRAKNVGTVERALRILGGGALATLGLALLVAAGGPAWLIAVDAVLILLGLDFVLTGMTGHCPLYQWLGWSTVRSTARR